MDLLQPMKPIDSNNFLQITLSKDDGMSWVAMSAGYQVCWTLLNYGWCHWLACPDDRTQCRIQRPDLLRSGMKILAYLSSSFIPQGWKQPKLSFPVGIDYKEKQALGHHEPSSLNRRLVVLWVLRWQPRALCPSSFRIMKGSPYAPWNLILLDTISIYWHLLDTISIYHLVASISTCV